VDFELLLGRNALEDSPGLTDNDSTMRIGVMLRTIDEKGGIGVYSRNIVRELLRLDQQNEYVLFYRTSTHMGEYAAFSNAREKLVRGKYKAIWDQLAVPLACWREKIDVVFHPKFTTPLLAPCKAVMVVHGADYFFPEHAQYYHPLDVLYAKIMMPVYFRKASVVISVSQLTTDNYRSVLDLPEGKIQTVYFAPARHFRRITDTRELETIKSRYALPDRFIFTLTKRKGGDRKNLAATLEAYRKYHSSSDNPYHLVIGGKDCHLFREEYGIPDDGYGSRISFPGWIDQKDLPSVYSQADLFLYPSNLEAFPIPITEAMACGTPIITSDANGLREIAGEAAKFVDPTDSDGIADAVGQVLSNSALRSKLTARGLERSAAFSWVECAKRTLAILKEVVRN